MTQVRLTKKRLSALNTALSLDAVLYEKFRRMNEDLHRHAERFCRRGNVAMVRRRTPNNTWEVLQIEKVYVTEQGQIVEVR